MKLQINTVKLQELVSKSVRGVGNNKLIPLTSLMAIELKDNVLTLTTTDGNNYLYISEDIEGDDFYTVVGVDVFAKLVSRLTCETVTLEVTENGLVVKGNGTYTIELPLDEEGQTIKYPNPLANCDLSTPTATLELHDVDLILNSLRSSLATNTAIPCYTGYYVGDKVVATDTYKIAGLDKKILDEPKLISPYMMNLLSMGDEDFTVYVLDNNVIVFTTKSCKVYGTAMEWINEFQIDAISELLNDEFGSMCKLSKNAVLQLLDRLSLFVGMYDKNGINLSFMEEGVEVSSKSSSGVEIIPYVSVENFTEFNCLVDIEMLRTQIQTHVGDTIELWFGKDNALKLVDGLVTQIVALGEVD